mgnify:FL=1
MINPIDVLNTSSVTAIDDSASVKKDYNFSDLLSSAINKVNGMQYDALNEDLSLSQGNADQMHDVMLSSVKADLALELTIAVRNKALDAYQEIMRMQV